MEVEREYYIINAMGKDRAGLIAMLTKVVAKGGFNIIDIEQSAPHGLFYIIMIIEPTIKAYNKPLQYFRDRFEELAAGSELNISINPFTGGFRKSSKSWLRFIFVGPDRPGMISAFSDYTGRHSVNIHRLRMVSRGEIIATESLLDVSGLETANLTLDEFKKGLMDLGKKLGIQIIIESENAVKKKIKKLMILDLDENLIQVQGLSDFLAKLKLNDEDIQFIKEIGNTDKSYDAKNVAVKYLKGCNTNMIDKIIKSIIISPGTEELIRALQLMNYSIALISNSLTIFTDYLKDQMNLEYAFGNKLELSNDHVTGKFIKSLEINPKKKKRLIEWLANMEKVPEEEIVQFGLNDIAFNNKEISHSIDLKICIGFDYNSLLDLIKLSKLTITQILSILIIIGMQKSQIDKIRNL